MLMHKDDLAKYLAENSDCNLEDAKVIIHYALGIISHALKDGHTIALDDIGELQLEQIEQKLVIQ